MDHSRKQKENRVKTESPVVLIESVAPKPLMREDLNKLCYKVAALVTSRLGEPTQPCAPQGERRCISHGSPRKMVICNKVWNSFILKRRHTLQTLLQDDQSHKTGVSCHEGNTDDRGSCMHSIQIASQACIPYPTSNPRAVPSKLLETTLVSRISVPTEIAQVSVPCTHEVTTAKRNNARHFTASETAESIR